jgi:hypothetical protein
MHTWALWHILIHIFVLAAFICGDRAEQEPERGGAGRAALWPLLLVSAWRCVPSTRQLSTVIHPAHGIPRPPARVWPRDRPLTY